MMPPQPPFLKDEVTLRYRIQMEWQVRTPGGAAVAQTPAKDKRPCDANEGFPVVDADGKPMPSQTLLPSWMVGSLVILYSLQSLEVTDDFRLP
jgi:hypothetical protein